MKRAVRQANISIPDEPLQLISDHLQTPIGELIILADGDGNLRAVDWADYETRMLRLLERHYGASGFKITPSKNPYGLTAAFSRYFEGDLTALKTVPSKTAGTPFQRAVWQALRTIPCGSTVSYAKLAGQIGKPSAMRAVGLANGSNPVGIVVPCHRVIGADGSITGYGGGIERKRWLLQHEAKLLAPAHFEFANLMRT